MKISRVFDILDSYIEKDAAITGKVNGEWKSYSDKDYIKLAKDFSFGLIELGISKDDKVATIMNNRPEWNFIDMGILQIGAVHVPIYPTISDEEFSHILKDSDAKLLIVSDKTSYNKISKIISEIPEIKNIFTIDDCEEAKNISEIFKLGESSIKNSKENLDSIKSTISKDDLASIIYTSGTTGLPKGVMLTHNNFVSDILDVYKSVPLTSDEKVLSFLPLCHVYERTVNYIYQYLGIQIIYAENFGTIADNLKKFKIEGFVTVPRVLEMVYEKIITKGKDLNGIKKKLFFWAVKIGNEYSHEKSQKGIYKIKLIIARKLIFNKWKEALGGNLHMIVSGGSALQPRLARMFDAAGIVVQEGYGLTETSPVISFNDCKLENNKIGTVGRVIESIDVKIAEDGEILVRGPIVMKGYYKRPDLTAEVIDSENWFHTGDIGNFDNEGFLKITDRKKEIFKNSAGKYIAPQAIENKLKESTFIDQVMVVGDGEKFASALISPNFNNLHFWSSKHNIHYRDNYELVRKEEVIKRYQKEINGINKSLGQVEQIKRFRLVCEEWTAKTKELSPTLKLKRKNIYKKYDHILREIYGYSSGEENRAVQK